MSTTTELAQRMKAAAINAKDLGNIARYSKGYEAIKAFSALMTPDNVLALVEALEARDKQITELRAKDINVKRQAQALFDAIQNPDDAYIPAYVRCLRNALAGVAVEGE